ncbi:hypothetical protein ACVWZM_002114 [Bradyrhizobium sp. USDA 4501]
MTRAAATSADNRAATTCTCPRAIRVRGYIRTGSTALRYIGHALRSLLSNSMAVQWREPQAVARASPQLTTGFVSDFLDST